MRRNVGTIERWISAVAGGALLAYGAYRWVLSRRRGAPDKAFRGKWPLPEGARPAGERPDDEDLVDEASRESFPASDPPAFTPTGVG